MAPIVVVGEVGDREVRQRAALHRSRQHRARRRVVHAEAVQQAPFLSQLLPAVSSAADEVAEREDRRTEHVSESGAPGQRRDGAGMRTSCSQSPLNTR